MAQYRGGCWVLEEAGFQIECCSSCHEDQSYGYDLCQIDLPNGDWLHVCCLVLRDLTTNVTEQEILERIDKYVL